MGSSEGDFNFQYRKPSELFCPTILFHPWFIFTISVFSQIAFLDAVV